MIRAFDVHGYTHRRGVRYEWMSRVVAGHDNTRANRLLSQIVIQNPLLDALHDISPEEANYRQVHARVHQSKRIPRCNNTIESWQILESTTNNLHLWMRAELQSEDIAKILPSTDKY